MPQRKVCWGDQGFKTGYGTNRSFQGRETERTGQRGGKGKPVPGSELIDFKPNPPWRMGP